MIKILADNTLPHLSTWFSEPFHIDTYHSYQELIERLPHYEILLCRSTLQVTEALLTDCSIQCVATASSGIDHIDVNSLNRLGIKVLDAKGANAEAVADYVIASLAYLQQHHGITGNNVGVIGMGEVGSRVAKRLSYAGFNMFCYDPFKAMVNPDIAYCQFEDLLDCDILCIHANLHAHAPYPSIHLIDAHFLKKMKPNIAIINASRGTIIHEKALLSLKKPILYCTDVYESEPYINPDVIELATLCTPHIAGHTLEAKQAILIQISEKLHHHYGLDRPHTLNHPTPLDPLFAHIPHHATEILSWYHPIHDTLQLKNAPDKAVAFQKQRRYHVRHDFSWHLKNDNRINVMS